MDIINSTTNQGRAITRLHKTLARSVALIKGDVSQITSEMGL